MKLQEFSRHILFGDSIENKLLSIDKLEFDEFRNFDIPFLPSREKKIMFDNRQSKFPKGHFHLNEKKAQAIHSFANHELLAIEMMACALLMYPHDTAELKNFKKGIYSSLVDEQVHFKLYVDRLNELGYEFGDFPLNDFFWGQMKSLKTPSQYLSVMSLSFEAANLDFADYFRKQFESVEDFKTANILKKVLKDEISHVALGVSYLNKWKQDKTLWEYYLETLPWPLTPARAKGKILNLEDRYKAKLSHSFMDNLMNYKDEFSITNRKEWK